MSDRILTFAQQRYYRSRGRAAMHSVQKWIQEFPAFVRRTISTMDEVDAIWWLRDRINLMEREAQEAVAAGLPATPELTTVQALTREGE